MTWRTVTFAGFAAIAAAAVAWGLAAGRSGAVTLGQAMGLLTRQRTTRIILFLVWAWLGWHLFVRGNGAYTK